MLRMILVAIAVLTAPLSSHAADQAAMARLRSACERSPIP